MSNTIDARGFSCPQPVLMALKEMDRLKEGEIIIFVDTDTSRENVTRAAGSRGWRVNDIQSEGDGYRITLTKG
jgi:tRNA 2-thiouridine synthesizing protein A